MPEPIVNTYLARIQTDPQGDNPTATAFFGETTAIDGKTFEAPWEPVSWSLNSDKTIDVPGVGVLTYKQVSDAVAAIAYQEKSATS